MSSVHWRRAMTAGALVSSVPASTLGGALLGYGVDTLLGTGRWFTFLLLFAGFGVGVAQLFRGIAKLSDVQPPDPPP